MNKVLDGRWGGGISQTRADNVVKEGMRLMGFRLRVLHGLKLVTEKFQKYLIWKLLFSLR